MGRNSFNEIDTISVFNLVIRKSTTLVGLNRQTNTIVAPGGPCHKFDRDIIETALRERESMCGRQMETIWAHPQPQIFFMDANNRKVVPPNLAAGVSNLNLHIYVMSIEVTGGNARECDSERFYKPSFQSMQYFADNERRLSPSLNQALHLYKGKGWPKMPIPTESCEIDTLWTCRRLQNVMRLPPKLLSRLFQENMVTA